MKKALSLQGWFQKTDSNWYPWLKFELEKKGNKVLIKGAGHFTKQDSVTNIPEMLKYV